MVAASAKFHGSYDELQTAVERTGIKGAWTEHENKHYRFEAINGAVLNWWDTKKKTVTFQGPSAPKDALAAAFNKVLESGEDNIPFEAAKVPVDPASTRVFVVHGHDEHAREQLERILMILGLEPFVLQNTAGDGLTIIEALERQIGREPVAKFGIVLMTPDDVGYAKVHGTEKADDRARQNVVLEMGMLLSSLTREKVVVLVKGHVELPSDANGIIYLHFNDHVKEKATQLAERLSKAGFDIPAEKITKAAA
ncbi:nucleotide-binding protein [Qipengyuania flava]|nr:nucleotide-binding protein [Qipengyuania flava]